LELPFELEPRIAVGTSVEDHLAVCSWPDACKPVVLVGHQPTLGSLAAYLLTGSEADWSIRKGSCWWFVSRAQRGTGEASLKAMIEPSLLL
jgi:phosphohistidine phosphatase